MRLRCTQQARADIDAVYAYIAHENPKAAQQVLDRIEQAIDHLPDHLEMGRKGRAEETRELVVLDLPSIIAYQLSDPFIDILAIVHTSRRWGKHLMGSLYCCDVSGVGDCGSRILVLYGHISNVDKRVRGHKESVSFR